MSIFFCLSSSLDLAFPVLIYHIVTLWPAFPSVLVNVWIISLFMSSFCYLCSIFLLFGCWVPWTNHLMLSSFSSHSHLFVLLLYFLWDLSPLDFLKLLSCLLLWFKIWLPFSFLSVSFYNNLSFLQYHLLIWGFLWHISIEISSLCKFFIYL